MTILLSDEAHNPVTEITDAIVKDYVLHKNKFEYQECLIMNPMTLENQLSFVYDSRHSLNKIRVSNSYFSRRFLRFCSPFSMSFPSILLNIGENNEYGNFDGLSNIQVTFVRFCPLSDIRNCDLPVFCIGR